VDGRGDSWPCVRKNGIGRADKYPALIGTSTESGAQASASGTVGRRSNSLDYKTDGGERNKRRTGPSTKYKCTVCRRAPGGKSGMWMWVELSLVEQSKGSG